MATASGERAGRTASKGGDDARTLDFIVIGSGRCGTTSLWKYLDSHPEIATPPDKEQAFFSQPRSYERGLARYMRRVVGSADPEAKCGKVTPAYMPGDDAEIREIAKRIRETVPGVRLIALLRDPVERAVATHRSWLRESQEKGRKPVRSFRETVREKPGSDTVTSKAIVTGGEYGRILSVYLEFFPREQLFVAFTEDLERRPRELMRRLFEFIGVDRDHEPPNLGQRFRQGGVRSRVSREEVDEVIDYMRENVWSQVRDPKREKERGFNWWLRFIWNIEPDDEGKVVDPATRQLLETHFAADVGVLRERIGVEPPWGKAYESSAAGSPARPVPTPPPPNFLIIGAQKSGTRWLRRNLGKHPEIFTADRECSYFSDQTRYERGAEWYRRQFLGWDGEPLVGEATPAYMMWRGIEPVPDRVAARIHADLPADAKLIAILRDPVERTYSAFIHHMLHERIRPDEDLLERVASKPARGGGLRLVMGGMYGESLEPFHRRFGDRLGVFLQDDAKRDPHAFYREVLEFLGAEPEFAPDDLAKLVGSYSPPEASPYRSAEGGKRPLTSGERGALFEYFREDIERLEAMTGRSLDVWRP